MAANGIVAEDFGAPDCSFCDDTGWIIVRDSHPMLYVGPGPCPEHATGVCDAPCECDRACRLN
jgi:hypothetical protein